MRMEGHPAGSHALYDVDPGTRMWGSESEKLIRRIITDSISGDSNFGLVSIRQYRRRQVSAPFWDFDHILGRQKILA